MTYKQTLDYLYAQLPMFHRVGASAFKKDLSNTLALCSILDNPQHKFKSIHIAGTNGKGSTAHLLSAVFQAKGLKVGMYVSPHYKDFRERIKINGQYIPQKYVVNFVEKHKEAFQTIQPSFFEMTVALAFDYFATQKVDIAIVEVGMGGRFDSTNVITPLLSVITNISLDHTDFLGDTLDKIAFEKAGIIKENVPVVIGERHPETSPVFIEKANEKNAPIFFAEDQFDVKIENHNYTHSQIIVNQKDKYLINLHGTYQRKNIGTVLQTVAAYNQFIQPNFIEKQDLEKAFFELKTMTKFMGRWQMLGENPLIIGDSAHNEGGLHWVFEQVSKVKFDQLHIVTGFVKDKNLAKALSFFPQNATYYFAKANIPRGLDAKVLQNEAAQFGLKGKHYSSVKNAYKAAKRHAKPTDLILVVGSIFVLGEVI